MAEFPEYFSHSAYSQYTRCGLQYKFQRIDKIPTPPAWYFIGGKAVHLATQWMDEQDAYPYQKLQLERIWRDAYDEEINQAFQEWPEDGEWLQVGRRGAEQGYRYWDERGWNAVNAWHEWRFQRDWDMDIVSIEEEIEVPLPSGIVLKGYIDRVLAEPGEEFEGMWPHVRHVLDIKSGTKRPPSPLQLGFYKVGLELKDPTVSVVGGSWWMAKDGKAFPVDWVDKCTVEMVDTLAVEYYRGVENDVFLPNPGDACFFCPFKKVCDYAV